MSSVSYETRVWIEMLPYISIIFLSYFQELSFGSSYY